MNFKIIHPILPCWLLISTVIAVTLPPAPAVAADRDTTQAEAMAVKAGALFKAGLFAKAADLWCAARRHRRVGLGHRWHQHGYPIRLDQQRLAMAQPLQRLIFLIREVQRRQAELPCGNLLQSATDLLRCSGGKEDARHSLYR